MAIKAGKPEQQQELGVAGHIMFIVRNKRAVFAHGLSPFLFILTAHKMGPLIFRVGLPMLINLF